MVLSKLTIIAVLIGQKSNFLVTTKEGGFTQVCSKAKDVTKICKISQCALYKQPSFIGGFGGGDGLVNHNVSFCEIPLWIYNSILNLLIEHYSLSNLE